MTLHILNNKQPDLQKAIELYTDLGWGQPQNYNLEIWQKAFNNSHFITAYEENELIGFVRLISDGFHDTQVLEFAVSPKHQHQGTGKALLNALKTNWGHTDIYCNTLPKTADFFLNNGFNKNHLTAVSFDNAKNQ
ncbi:MAG: GNAT family N-acetyltransferase [Alphaproteobacteria bacterium]|nr:GNAT family N-acetyltransferase [Alphaproteobacteria bacterium]MBO5442073.1 GNAT family N-acetyltransferase [Alphaproteobacteria bacterium]